MDLNIFMKVIIENFKGWIHKEVKLPSSGLTLISAVSGNGKSSILEAISFAITGTASGKIKNINSTGNPKVTVTFGDLEIVRSRAPNVLRVTTPTGKYEGVEAQAYIDNVFTTHFSKIGYIRQKGVAAFLEMSGPAKMEFLQEWVLSDSSINSLKVSAKEVAKQKKDELHNLEVQLQVETEFFESLEKPDLVKTPFPEGKDEDEVYQDWVKDNTRNRKLLKGAENQRLELIKELKDTKTRESQEQIRDSTKTKLKEVNRQLKEASVGTPETVKAELERKGWVNTLRIEKVNLNTLNEIDKNTEWTRYSADELEKSIERIKRDLVIKKNVDRLREKIGKETRNDGVREELDSSIEIKEKFEKADDYSQEEEDMLKKKMEKG